MTQATKIHAVDRADAESKGAIWVGKGSAWWPRIPPPPEPRPGKRQRATTAPETALRRMLNDQPAIKKAARELLAGQPIADGSEEGVTSVADILVEATR